MEKKNANAAAAKWWADQIRRGTKQDNGDQGPNGFFVTAMASMNNGTDARSADSFEEKLRARLDEFGTHVLSTDYDPDRILSEVAKEAGVRPRCGPFPMKTVMWIDAHKVQVKHGYAAPIDTIYRASRSTP